MPCLMLDETPKTHNKVEYENGPSISYMSEEATWLYYELQQEANFLIIDCRPFTEYSRAHIKGAINLAISDLMLRRLKKGNMPLTNLMNSDTSKDKFERRAQFERIVVYDSDSRKETLDNNVIKFLLNKLCDGNRVCFLEGGFLQFKEHYPQLCQCGSGSEIGIALQSLSTLKLSDSNNNCNNSLNLKLQEYPQMRKEPCRYNPESSGPIEIIPHLYLGSKSDSTDRKCLETYQIKFILNVTHDLPNHFEEDGELSYLKLPVEDNWEGDLVKLFPKAFAFIEKAIDCRKNVLVHCVGGVSRSSTVVIAYLMLKHGYSLNDAFDHVKAKKSNISPNFNFMQQLLDIERTQAPEEGSETSISSHSSFESQISDLPNNIP